LPPDFEDIVAWHLKRAVIKFLVTAPYNTPIYWAAERTMTGVVTFIEDLFEVILNLSDAWSSLKSTIIFAVDAEDQAWPSYP
jgi:hypothetical protein